MATIVSSASGNFSAPSTWVGGVVPGASDIAVASSGHVVALDTNVTVSEIQSYGGRFTLGNGRTLTALIRSLAPASIGTVEMTATTSATVVGNVIGPYSGASSAIGGISVTGGGTLNVIGNVYGGNSSVRHGIYSTNGNVNVVGDCHGYGGVGIYSVSTTTLSSSTARGSVTITGNVFSSSSAVATTGHGVFTSGPTGSIYVTGNVTAFNAIGLYSTSSSADIFVTGNVTGGTQGANSYGIYVSTSSATRLIWVVGTVTARAAGHVGHGIYDAGAGGAVVVLSGSSVDSVFGDSAVVARRIRRVPTLNSTVTHAAYSSMNISVDSGYVTYKSLDSITNNVPIPSDVRAGVSYASGELLGTMQVPQADSVAFGVSVDSTTGTAPVTKQALARILGPAVSAGLNKV